MKLAIVVFCTFFTFNSAQRNLRKGQNQQQQQHVGGGYGSSNGTAGTGAGGKQNGNRMGGNILVNVTPVPLSQAEMDELLYMVEEEKLAHDVYEQFFNQYQIPIFDNIRNSEQHHGDLVRQALQLHGLADPTTGKLSGQFVNVNLGTAYTTLVASGSTSLGGALRAGAKIEETDIQDLNDALQDTAVPYLDQMYGKLRRASENHLRAFVQALNNIGEGPYTPTVLSADEYNDIIN